MSGHTLTLGRGRGRRSNNRSTPYGRGGGGGGGDADAAKRVFVGNLAYSVAWQDLKDHMKQAGEVTYCDIIPDSENRSLSSGSALVEYASAKQAKKAIRELTDTELEGWTIFVREDRVGLPIGAVTGGSVDRSKVFPGLRGGRGRGRGRGRAPGGGRAGGGRAGGGGKARVVIRTKDQGGGGGGGGRQIFVANLPYSATWQNLKDVFKTQGEVERAEIQGQGGSGTVVMATAKQAQAAVRHFDGADFDGRIIGVRMDSRA